jgi:hypothetical protein
MQEKQNWEEKAKGISSTPFSPTHNQPAQRYQCPLVWPASQGVGSVTGGKAVLLLPSLSKVHRPMFSALVPGPGVPWWLTTKDDAGNRR